MVGDYVSRTIGGLVGGCVCQMRKEYRRPAEARVIVIVVVAVNNNTIGLVYWLGGLVVRTIWVGLWVGG